MIIGIDASNIRAGGGLTHLSELLKNMQYFRDRFSYIIVFAPSQTLKNVLDADYIRKTTHVLLDQNFITRLYWQNFILPKECKGKIDVLFNLGGTFFKGFHPYISMSQNMLVFDVKERKRYGFSYTNFRLQLLKFLQLKAFNNADGMIFISNYAKAKISPYIKIQNSRVIPHGISKRFFSCPRIAKDITAYNITNPFRVLYVSIIDVYKHQYNVAKAVSMLRNLDNLPIELHLVGGFYRPAYRRLLKGIKAIKESNHFIHIHGAVSYDRIDEFYKSADLFVFASTCENMPNIVLEAMSAGLPISSSSSLPMPEFLKDCADYFEPDNVDQIYTSLKKLIMCKEYRESLSNKSFQEAKQYTWMRCSNDTLTFLEDTLKNSRQCVE